ncbi:MAG: hypothetical protein NVSMB26_06460 [Beijerinckiaceae bacterium]
MFLWILSSGGLCALSGALGLGHLYELNRIGQGAALIVSVIAALVFFATWDIQDERSAAQRGGGD